MFCLPKTAWPPTSLNEIKEKLAALGLSLGSTFEPDLLEAPKEETLVSIPR